MGLADVHAHLTHPRFAGDLVGVIARARDAGVTSIVVNGLNAADNAAVRDLARREPAIRPAFGLYPVDAVLPEMRALGIEYPREGPEPPVAESVAWLRAHVDEAFAVGEIGLDGYWVPVELWPRQEEIFRELVALAMAADKPIVIHTRKREQRALEILTEMGARRVCWHCFGGKVRLAQRIAAHGHWLSIPANAQRSESFTRMLQTIPPERLLLETDCPYLSPDRVRPSEPADVAATAAYSARLWEVTPAVAEERFAASFAALFGVLP